MHQPTKFQYNLTMRAWVIYDSTIFSKRNGGCSSVFRREVEWTERCEIWRIHWSISIVVPKCFRLPVFFIRFENRTTPGYLLVENWGKFRTFTHPLWNRRTDGRRNVYEWIFRTRSSSHNSQFIGDMYILHFQTDR